AAIDPARVAGGDREAWRSVNGYAPGDVVALFAATNGPLKGLGPLLHALARLPDAVPLKVAAVAVRDAGPFVRLARRLGVAGRVRFYPHTAAMGAWYRAADLLVHPTFYDPCSLVVLEALACGLPVITSRFNGAAERFHSADEGVVLDDPHDDAALAAALTRLADPACRARMAGHAPAVAGRWTYEDHYRALLSVFDEAAERRRAG
ncbi:MAG: glycosyltransferase, partial [Gemmataceae bacterium]